MLASAFGSLDRQFDGDSGLLDLGRGHHRQKRHGDDEEQHQDQNDKQPEQDMIKEIGAVQIATDPNEWARKPRFVPAASGSVVMKSHDAEMFLPTH